MKRIVFIILFLCLPATAAAQITTRVVNGMPADNTDYPWMSSLVVRGFSADIGSFCGGTLIAHDWVLTSAHCFFNSNGLQDINTGNLDVFVGIENLEAEDGIRLQAEQIIINPGYNPDTDDADVALVRLSSALSVPTLMPLPQSDSVDYPEPGATARVLGWGAISIIGPSSDHLLEADLPIVPQNDLINAYGSFEITSNMIGAGDGTTDACRGDSGGPLLVRDASGDYWRQAGIVSFGVDCANPDFPGVHARVARFTDWIAGHVDDADPFVAAVLPADNAIGVPTNSNFSVTFSEDVNPNTVNATSFSLDGDVTAAVKYNRATRTAALNPGADLLPLTTYNATLTTGVQDHFGKSLDRTYTWSFTTGAGPEADAPGVDSVSPASGAAGIAMTSNVAAIFDADMDASSFNSDSFYLVPEVASVLDYDEATRKITLNPLADLEPSTVYSAVLTRSVESLTDNGLSSMHSWTFTTAAEAGITDTDGDGVPDAADGNPNDDTRASLDPEATADQVELAVTGGSLRGVQAISDTSVDQSGKPGNYTFPYGLARYQVLVPANGASATITLTYPAALPSGTRIYKTDDTGFTNITSSPNVAYAGNLLILTLTDGGFGDADGVANGVIIDPVGPAAPPPPAPAANNSGDSSGGGGGSGGCSIGGENHDAGATALLIASCLALALGRLRGVRARSD